MHVRRLTGLIMVAEKCVSRKASIHAGSTGLTGLTGVAGAHVCKAIKSECTTFKNLLVRTIETTLTLLTLNKASIHAGFDVTGFASNTVMPRKEA
jgi:hypothetical protein